MKRKLFFIILIISSLFMLFSCETTDSSTIETDSVSSASETGTGWKIEVLGAREVKLYQSSLLDWEDNNSEDFSIMNFESKGVLNSYKVISFAKIIGMIDDANPDLLNQELWNSGYEITLEADDGYSTGFNTQDVNINDIYLATEKNGETIMPSILGNISSSIRIKNLSKIEAKVSQINLEENDFTFEIEIGNIKESFTINELLNSEFYYEGPGQYINSYGNTFQYTWAGIKLVDFLSQYTTLTKENILTIKSMDGFEMDYSGEQILDQNDGLWLLAIKQDGEFMAEDPGYIRLVKVGPQNPLIDGHCSARMVQKIIIDTGEFNDFSISIEDGNNVETMDRQTLQSGVSANKSKINFYNKKNDSIVQYLGLPLYDFFLRYPNYKTVTIEATDGFKITLNRSEIENNKDVIIAMFYGDGSELDISEFPLVLVWDKDASLVPQGIKNIKCISKFILQ